MPPFQPITQHSPPMFALHSIPASHPILTPEDHALLALIVEERFTLTHIVANYESAHPARQSLLTLTRWLKLPHIDAALKTLLADLREYESIRHEFLQRHSIDGLVDAMHSASRNLKLLEEARTHNIQHTRAVEELRLAAQALNRATKPGGTAPRGTAPRDTASRGTVPAPRGRAASEYHSSDPSSDQCESDVSHSEGVHVRSRGVESRSDDTPGKITPNISTRSPDAPTCDDNSLSTGSASDQCVSASSSPRSGARDEPGVATPGKESTPITLPSASLSTEGAPHSTRSLDALTCAITPSPSTPRHLDTLTPRHLLRPPRHPLQFAPANPPDALSVASRRQLNHPQYASRTGRHMRTRPLTVFQALQNATRSQPKIVTHGLVMLSRHPCATH